MNSRKIETPESGSFLAAAERGGPVLACSGDWTVRSLERVEKQLTALVAGGGDFNCIDLGDVRRMDTSGALVLLRLRSDLARGASAPPVFKTDNPDFSRLLEQLGSYAARERQEDSGKKSAVVFFLNKLGGDSIREFREGWALIAFLGHFLTACASMLRRPRAFRFTSLVHHMEQAGLAAVPIVALLSFLIGLVIAYMGAQLLVQFGANVYVVKLVEISILRELGVLLTAILVAGRSGSSFTAEIGAMQSNEEVDAMRTMGLDPMVVLVLPRVLALLLMLPALVFLANVMAIFGGAVAASTAMDLSFSAFAAHFQNGVNLNNLFVGLVKAPFFAVIIGLVGCFRGFYATGSAESVGRLTTQAVVESIFLIIVANAVFAIFFMQVRI